MDCKTWPIVLLEQLPAIIIATASLVAVIKGAPLLAERNSLKTQELEVRKQELTGK